MLLQASSSYFYTVLYRSSLAFFGLITLRYRIVSASSGEFFNLGLGQKRGLVTEKPVNWRSRFENVIADLVALFRVCDRLTETGRGVGIVII